MERRNSVQLYSPAGNQKEISKIVKNFKTTNVTVTIYEVNRIFDTKLFVKN